MVAHWHLNPYDSSFTGELGTLDQLISQIRDFQPELIVVAPYQRTRLDEYIVESFTDVPSIGFSGYLYRGDISIGLDFSSNLTFSQTVTVSEDDHELRKNELLCSAILGRSVSLPPPALLIDESLLSRARRRLLKVGLQPKEYWISCIGHSGWSAVRNWGLHEWATALTAMVEGHGLHLLFIGTPDESEITEQVRQYMGAASASTLNLCTSPESTDLLVGLIAESNGYIGRDTGPMHIAAALSKPVVAVFGGGDWPIFVPAASQGGVLTTSVPCSGCHWICHLPESHCVKQVPLKKVIEELERTVNGAEGFRIHEHKADQFLLNRMAVEAGESAREAMRKSNATILNLEEQVRCLDSLINDERDKLLNSEARVKELDSLLKSEQNIVLEQAELLEPIRRSVFTRILTFLRIWRIFR